MLPKTLKNFNLFVEGEGFAGVVDELSLPKLTRKMEEYRAGGMTGPIEIDMGMEKLEMDFSLREFSRSILNQFGVRDHAGVGLRFLGTAERDDAGSIPDSIEIVVRGRWREMDFNSTKAAEMGTLKVSVAASYYKYLLNGDEVIEIDQVNMIEKVNGKDLLLDQRLSLSI